MMDLMSLFRGAYVPGVTGRAERNEMEALSLQQNGALM